MTLTGAPAPESTPSGADGAGTLYGRWIDKYHVVSIEDGLAENDWDGFREHTAALGSRIQIVIRIGHLAISDSKNFAKQEIRLHHATVRFNAIDCAVYAL